MALDLFEGSDDEADDISKIEINRDFARRFEHNKKREDLQRLEEMKKKGLVSDSDDSEEDSSDEEEDMVGSKKADVQLYDAILRVKKNDPAIYRKDTKLYSSSSDEEDDTSEKDDTSSSDEEGKEEEKKPKGKKEKPLYVKDVVAQHLLEEGPEFQDEPWKPRSKSYSEEQEENRRAFLEAAAEQTLGPHDGDDLFQERTGGTEAIVGEGRTEIRQKVDELFGEDENLDENAMFLKNFLLNEMWVDKDKGKKALKGEDLLAVSEEEEDLIRQDTYEAEYNFRYEEGAGDRVLGHSRFIEGSVRKKTNARKVQRKSKEERMVRAEFERKEELKHLKNLKKKEIQEKLQKIRQIAGIKEGGLSALDEDDLEEEFDPEDYDRKMKEMFDVDYYDAEDADPGFGSGAEDDLEKPDFEKEDELLGLPKDWDVCGSREGFMAARKRSLERKLEEKEEEEEGGEEAEDQEELKSESKRKKKRKISLREKVELEKELEEYYKLDYEDTIGDLKTRFKYKSVPANRYGLRAEEILMANDKDLNQYVSLKKFAPYRQDEWKVSRLKRHHQKMKMKLLLQGGKTDAEKIDKKHRLKDSGFKDSGKKSQLEESTGELSRRSRRRRRQAELKLSKSRLMAYGKIPPKSKGQKQH